MESLEERALQAYNHTLISRQIRQEVQIYMIQEGGGVLVPGDSYSKTGSPVREVLQKNQTSLQEIDTTDPIKSTFEFSDVVPDAEPLEISASEVEVVARYLGGYVGPRGVDARLLKDWCNHLY